MTTFERHFGGARYTAIKDGLAEVEYALAVFARDHGLRFAISTAFFLVNWLGGAVEVWLLMQLLGVPLPFAHCWVAEAAIEFQEAHAAYSPPPSRRRRPYLCNNSLSKSAPAEIATETTTRR